MHIISQRCHEKYCERAIEQADKKYRKHGMCDSVACYTVVKEPKPDSQGQIYCTSCSGVPDIWDLNQEHLRDVALVAFPIEKKIDCNSCAVVVDRDYWRYLLEARSTKNPKNFKKYIKCTSGRISKVILVSVICIYV